MEIVLNFIMEDSKGYTLSEFKSLCRDPEEGGDPGESSDAILEEFNANFDAQKGEAPVQDSRPAVLASRPRSKYCPPCRLQQGAPRAQGGQGQACSLSAATAHCCQIAEINLNRSRSWL